MRRDRDAASLDRRPHQRRHVQVLQVEAAQGTREDRDAIGLGRPRIDKDHATATEDAEPATPVVTPLEAWLQGLASDLESESLGDPRELLQQGAELHPTTSLTCPAAEGHAKPRSESIRLPEELRIETRGGASVDQLESG